jgi:hypothetical protein
MRGALLFALSACAVVKPIVASNDDLADHRTVSFSHTEGERLARATRYLERHPRGEWASEVRASFDAEEPTYYRASTKSRDAAIDYLAWLPHGPHASAAFALVRSFDEHEPEDEQSRMLARARADEARLERAAEERAEASEAALGAFRVVVDAAIYERPLSEAHELSRWLLASRNFGATPTLRTRTLSFTLPSRGAPLERTLEITIHVELVGDVVSASVVSGPALCSRIAEAALLREVTPAEAEAYVRDAVSTMARLRAPDLTIAIDHDTVRITPSRQASKGGL